MKVLILMGSDSDLDVMCYCAEVLEEFGIKYNMTVGSAHRTPERVTKLVRAAERKGADVLAAQIIVRKDKAVARKLKSYRRRMARAVEKKAAELE